MFGCVCVEKGRKYYLKCVCSAWKNAMTHLSSNINGVDVVVPPKLDLAAADRSSSRKYGKPPKYGNNCGPRSILLSANITYFETSRSYVNETFAKNSHMNTYFCCFIYVHTCAPAIFKTTIDRHSYDSTGGIASIFTVGKCSRQFDKPSSRTDVRAKKPRTAANVVEFCNENEKPIPINI